MKKNILKIKRVVILARNGRIGLFSKINEYHKIILKWLPSYIRAGSGEIIRE